MAETRNSGWPGSSPRGLLAVLMVCTLTCVVGAAPSLAKPVAHSILSGSVEGWLGDGTVWPDRALVLFAPHGAVVGASTVDVTEDGAAVLGVSVTPLRRANRRDLGVMVLVDQSPSMSGAPLSAALGAVRSLAATGPARQQLGVVAFSSRSHALVPLSSDPSTIGRALSGAPKGGHGAGVPGAIALALRQLSDAKVALGAIIVVSDGVGQPIGPGSASAAVQSSATAANVPVFTVGLRDQATSAASLRRLARVAGGQFVASQPARLAAVFHEIYSTVTRGYIVRWRSRAGTASSVAVAATVAGTPGSVQASYRSPDTSPSSTRLKQATGRRWAANAASHNPHKLSGRPRFALSPPAAAVAAAGSRPGSFWNTLPGILAVAGICGLLLTVALAMIFYRPSKRAVRTRVGSYIPALAAEGQQLASASSRRGLIERIESGAWWPPYVENVDLSGTARSPIALFKRAAVLGMVLAVVVTVVSGSVFVALIPLLFWPFALRKMVARSANKQREKFRDTLPGYLQDLASALRVGRSFVGGLNAVVETADEPVRGAFQRVVADESFGRPVEEAIEAVAERMQAPDLQQVALIAGLNRRSGSNVSEALDRVAEASRENASLRREVKALTGQARMSSWVLTALPAFLLAAMSLVSPLYAKPLLHTTGGIVLLAIGSAMVYGGFRVMKKITEVEP